MNDVGFAEICPIDIRGKNEGPGFLLDKLKLNPAVHGDIYCAPTAGAGSLDVEGQSLCPQTPLHEGRGNRILTSGAIESLA
jgi:hypothetical protein